MVAYVLVFISVTCKELASVLYVEDLALGLMLEGYWYTHTITTLHRY